MASAITGHRHGKAWRKRVPLELSRWQHQALHSPKKLIGCITPLGEGKSFLGALWLVTGACRTPGSVNLAIAAGYTALDDFVRPEVLRWCDRLKLDYQHWVQSKRIRINLGNGRSSEIRFRTVETTDAIQKLRGPEYHRVWMDEARNCAEQAFVIAFSRLRQNLGRPNQMLVTTTPNGFDWVYETFKGSKAEKLSGLVDFLWVRKRSNRHLPEGYDEENRAVMDAALAEQELTAAFVNMGNRLIRSFSRTTHVTDRVRYWPQLPLVVSVDFGAKNHAAVGQQVKGQFHVIDEFAIEGVEDLAATLADAYADHLGEWHVYGDSAMGSAKSSVRRTWGDSLRDSLALYDVHPTIWGLARSNPRAFARVQVTNSLFRAADGSVRIYVHPRCESLIRDLERLEWTEDGRQIKKTKEAKELSHTFDAASYWWFAAVGRDFVRRLLDKRGRDVRGEAA